MRLALSTMVQNLIIAASCSQSVVFCAKVGKLGYVYGIAGASARNSAGHLQCVRYSSVVLFALVVIQGLIGFSAETSDMIVGIHFINFLLLYGISIAMVFYAFRWNRMGSMAQ
jgi:hypothetical protein